MLSGGPAYIEIVVEGEFNVLDINLHQNFIEDGSKLNCILEQRTDEIITSRRKLCIEEQEESEILQDFEH